MKKNDKKDKKNTKEVFLEIQSIQNGATTSVFINDARMRKIRNNYKIEFDGTELCGMPGEITSLEINDNSVVKLTTGTKKVFSQMIMEQGVRHCSMRMDDIEGPLSMGISTRRIKTNLGENGGNLEVDYSLEFNNYFAGDHTMIITVKDKPRG